MADMTTVDRVKTYGGVTGAGDDATIQEIITAVSALVANFIHDGFDGTVITGEKHGVGLSRAIVLHAPAVTVQAVRIGSVLVDAGAYFLQSPRVVYGLDPVAYPEAEVDYTQSAVVPDDISLAVTEISAFMQKQTVGVAGGSRLGLGAQANSDTGSADYFVQALGQLPMAAATLKLHRPFV